MRAKVDAQLEEEWQTTIQKISVLGEGAPKECRGLSLAGDVDREESKREQL